MGNLCGYPLHGGVWVHSQEPSIFRSGPLNHWPLTCARRALRAGPQCRSASLCVGQCNKNRWCRPGEGGYRLPSWLTGIRWPFLLGLEGVALLRAFAGDDLGREFVEANRVVSRAVFDHLV